MSTYRHSPTDALMLRSDLRREEQAWRLGFARGRRLRRQVFYASLVGAAWLLLRNPRKHIMLRALVFYGLLMALLIATVLSPLLVCYGLVKVSRRAVRWRRYEWPRRGTWPESVADVTGPLDAIRF
jgi:hypothetical protein